MSFSDLSLIPQITRVLSENGYSQPSPIQSQAIPAILAGQDVIACAQTGTGKTAAFSLPIIQNLGLHDQNKQPLQASRNPLTVLVLTPTRELASQVGESIEKYSKYLPIRSSVIFGGVNMQGQINHLRRGLHILVATPGRLLDHIRQRTIDLSAIKVLVLDEADRMLDMGFIHDVRRIISHLPKQRQNLLFSATFSPAINQLASQLLNSPKVIEVARQNSVAELISQTVYPVDHQRKRELLTHLIRSHDLRQVLVFTRTKHGANRLSQQLERSQISATAIHGNKSQGARTRALRDFKEGAVQVLVATDIAARGLDIDQLPFVINFDLPNVAEDYVHRIGRTGRAGSKGEAFSLVSADDQKLLHGIERLLNQKITKRIVPGFEPGQEQPRAALAERPTSSLRPTRSWSPFAKTRSRVGHR